MKDVVFITGNQNKADYLAKWLGIAIPHRKIELEELQSLDLREVVEHKARSAYAIVKQPVLVEDVALVFNGMGRLPGTFIRWFLEEVGNEGLSAIAQGLDDKSAYAAIMYGLFDGKEFLAFDGRVDGIIAERPRDFAPDNGWKTSLSWNTIFIPNGSAKTYAEMSDEELAPFSHRAQAIQKLKAYLTK